MSEIAHYTGVSGVHAQTAVQKMTQVSAGSRVTGDAAFEAGLTAAMTTSQKICAVLVFCLADRDSFLFLGYGNVFLYQMPQYGTDSSTFNRK